MPLTHSLRTIHYDPDGDYCHLGSRHDGVFEDCHTHPIIELDARGAVQRIAHSEIKRGVCALPYDAFQPVMRAYTKWMALVEDPRFVIPLEWPEHSLILVNNHRVLHGRQEFFNAAGAEREMIGCYLSRDALESRLRSLGLQDMHG